MPGGATWTPYSRIVVCVVEILVQIEHQPR